LRDRDELAETHRPIVSGGQGRSGGWAIRPEACAQEVRDVCERGSSRGNR
jgi:hypothetical protein